MAAEQLEFVVWKHCKPMFISECVPLSFLTCVHSRIYSMKNKMTLFFWTLCYFLPHKCKPIFSRGWGYEITTLFFFCIIWNKTMQTFDIMQKKRHRHSVRLRLRGAIYRPDSFVLMSRYCANLKAIRYESTTLNRIVDDKSHRVILASIDSMVLFCGMVLTARTKSGDGTSKL